MVAITAFEARDIRSLRRPSQIMAYFVMGIYLFCVIGELLNVSWTNQALPEIYGGTWPPCDVPNSSADIRPDVARVVYRSNANR